MTQIRINHFEETWECNDCGTIYDEQLIISKDGEVVYTGLHDGHFGNGDNITDPVVVLENVLKALGFTVEVVNDKDGS
jgi:hypothetical protein